MKPKPANGLESSKNTLWVHGEEVRSSMYIVHNFSSSDAPSKEYLPTFALECSCFLTECR